MKNHLSSAQDILIVLPNNIDADKVAAALGLGQLLNKGRKITFASSKPLEDEFKNIFNFEDFKFINQLQNKEIVLSINRKKGNVRSVRWREVEGRVQFIITPDKGPFEFDGVDLNTEGSDYDLIITLACQSLDTSPLHSTLKNLGNKTPIINIDTDPNNTKFGKVNKLKKNLSLSSLILEIAEEEDLELSREAIQTLLQGIIWSNEGFRQSRSLEKAMQRAKTFSGDTINAISKIFETLTIAELRYIGKMISNMHTYSRDIITSKIRYNDMQDIQLERVLYPEINILSRVQGYKVAMILSEQKKRNIYARIYSQDESINIFDLFSQFSPIGNTRRISFTHQGDIDRTEELLLKKIRSKITKPAKAPVKTAKERQEPSSEKGTNSQQDPLARAQKLPKPLEPPEIPQIPYYPQQAKPPQPLPPINPLPPAQ